MSRLLWMLAGFFGGVSLARNAQAFSAPAASAVILLCIVACGVSWWAAYRGKSQAVASAVAIATAQARVDFDAQLAAVASAQANQAVQVNVHGDRAQLVDQVHELDAIAGAAGTALGAQAERAPYAGPVPIAGASVVVGRHQSDY